MKKKHKGLTPRRTARALERLEAWAAGKYGRPLNVQQWRERILLVADGYSPLDVCGGRTKIQGQMMRHLISKCWIRPFRNATDLLIRKAVQQHKDGKSLSAISRETGFSMCAVSNWVVKARLEELEARCQQCIYQKK